MNLFAFLRSFIARTFLTAYAGPGKTAGAPIVAPPPDWEPPAAPAPAKGAKGSKGDEEDADPDDLEEVKDGEEVDDGDDAGGDPSDDGDEEDGDEEDADGKEEKDLDDLDADEDDDEDEEDDETVDLTRDTLRAQLSTTIKAGGNPYDARFDVDAIKLPAERRKALLSKLTPKDADEDEVAGANGILDVAEEIAKEIALGLLGGYHNAAVVPVRESLDKSAGRAAMEREAEAVAKKNPELHDEAVQKRIVAELDKLDADFGPQVRRHLTVKKLLRLVPKSLRAAARTRVLEARGKSAGKRKEPRELSDEEQREVATGASSAPRNSKSNGVPGRKTKPQGDSEDRRALARHLQGGGRKVPFF